MSLFIGIGLIMLSAALESPADVYVTLDPPEIPFHRKAVYTIVVETPGDVEVGLPEGVERFGGLAVTDVKTDVENLKKGRKRFTQTYVLDAVFAGEYPIAPAIVSISDDRKIIVPSPTLRVRDLTDEEREKAEHFESIAGPISVKKTLTQRWEFWGVIALVVVVVLAVIVYFLWRRPKLVIEAPKATPWEVAYQRLQELDKRQLPKAGKYGVYYVDLSSILRYYIEDRFAVRAPEETTPEFISEAAKSGKFSELQQQSIAAFLRHCDNVKFAQYDPAIEKMDSSFSQVLMFVDETVPRPVSGEEEAAA